MGRGELPAFARAGQLFLTALLVTAGIVLGLSLFQARPERLLPLWWDEAGPVLQAALSAAGVMGWGLFLPFLMGDVRDQGEKKIWHWLFGGLGGALLLAAAQGPWRETVRTLALADELTLYCVFVACRWENKDEELFAMAKQVRGWGRVHAVRELEPVSQEMKTWLLDEGWDNDVLPAYTALACAQRGGLRERLEQEALSRAQLDAAGGLIQALLDEGPVSNISRMEDAEELLLAYMAQVERAELTLGALNVVRGILSAAAEDELDLSQVRTRAEALFASQASRRAVEQALERGEGFSLAAALGLAWQEKLLEALERDFAGTYSQLYLILAPEQELWVDRALAVCEKNLPRELATGPKDWTFAPPEEPRYNWLDYTVQFLKPFPGRGLELALTALEAPVIRNRNMALNALESWREAGWSFPEAVVQALERLNVSEVHDKLRERESALLDELKKGAGGYDRA